MPKKSDKGSKETTSNEPVFGNLLIQQDIEEEEEVVEVPPAKAAKPVAKAAPKAPELPKQQAKKPARKDAEEATPRKQDRFQRLLESKTVSALVARHGPYSITPASVLYDQKEHILPSGIYRLDHAIGGGFPWGHVIMFYGPPHSSKTTISMKLLANAQRTCVQCFEFQDKCACEDSMPAVCVFVDVEGTYNTRWADTIGIDAHRLGFARPAAGEEAVEVVEALIRSQDVDFIVVDSIALMTASKILEEEASHNAGMGVDAKLLSNAMRKWRAALNTVANQTNRRPTVVLVNHVYQAVGMVFGNPERVSGGGKVRYATTIEVRVQGVTEAEKDEHSEVTHATVKFTIQKNKWAPIAKNGEFDMLLMQTEERPAGSTFDEPAIRKDAEFYGLLTKQGNKYVLQGKEFSTHKALEDELYSDRPWRDGIIQELFRLGRKKHYVAPVVPLKKEGA